MKLFCYMLLILLISTTPVFASVSVSSPSNGETVSSPFSLNAYASNCSSQPIRVMGYSLDSGDTNMAPGSSIDVQVSASAGTHTLHVKAWGDKGAVCVADAAITVANVTDDVAADTSIVPANAVSVSSIQTLSNWRATHDTGTSGTASGKTSKVGSPSHGGTARNFVTSYKDGGGERYSVSFGDDRTALNFMYDGWVYLASPSSHVANLEMDLNQTMSNGQTVIFGFQCDGYSGTWDYTENKGTPEKFSDTWVHSKAACNPRHWSTGVWHHVQISYSRNESGKVTYKAVYLDGVKSTLNVTVSSAFALGWAATVSTNFQVDGLGSAGSSTVYLDDLTVQRW